MVDRSLPNVCLIIEHVIWAQSLWDLFDWRKIAEVGIKLLEIALILSG